MDTASLFDHAKGHTLPRDKETVRELGEIVRGLKANLFEDHSDTDSSAGSDRLC